MLSKVGALTQELAAACSDGLTSTATSLAGKVERPPVEGRRAIPTKSFPSAQEGQGPDFVPQRHFLSEGIQPHQTQPKVKNPQGRDWVLFIFT